MASVLSAIITQLITDVETTSITDCVHGMDTSSTKSPRAEIHLGSGSTDHDMTSVIDRTINMVVVVYGQTHEQTELALEEIIKLWRNAAKLAVLQALGMTILASTGVWSPPVYSSETQTPYMGDIEFSMTVRYTA